VAIRIYRTGFKPAKFFLIAWSILLIGAIIFVSKDFELVPYNIYSNYSLQVASILEVVLLSFALADKINVFRREKEQSQLEALKALEENERIVREQNIMLEAKVEERTIALKMVNEDLNMAMGDLKNAQSQLVSAEKMASLGQLTAGIAHEINNPINYVKSSVRPLKDNVAELLELIDVYETNLKGSGQRDAEDRINAFKDKIQFDYLIEETMDVINNIEEGANRTVEIVSGLRTFSHVDDIGLKMSDINKGIKSTMNLLSGEAPPAMKINLNLGKLPEVECYGGKINQVFMNILNNAIQAIKLKGGTDGEITITTTALDDRVRITIEDNGVGMSQEVKEKIFDPFFTTKDVGEGTGLGLSVVYGIIESHHGSIDVLSEPGKGASFIINLPYLQPK
jgi:signal transduction histidine kinase